MEQRIPWPVVPSTSYARPLVGRPHLSEPGRCRGSWRQRGGLAGRRSGQPATWRRQRGPSVQHTAWQPRQPAAAAPGARTTGRGRFGSAKAVRSQLARRWCAAARRRVPPLFCTSLPLHVARWRQIVLAPRSNQLALQDLAHLASIFCLNVFCHIDSMSKIDQIR